MNRVKEVVKEVSRKIGEMERKRKEMVKALRAIKDVDFRIGGLTKEKVINQVEKVEVSGKICGIDGGLQVRSFHGIDIIVVRAVGVCIEYEQSKVRSVKYYQPKAPKVISAETTSDAELIFLSSIYRMIEEIERACEVLEAESPDYLLLDGPVYPHPSIVAAKTVYPELYRKVIDLYNRLVEKGKWRVVGVVEDSRSKYLSRVLKEKIIPTLEEPYRKLFPQNIHEFRDTSLLFGALKKGERTFTFKVNGVRDVNYAQKVFAFYLKTAAYDRPVRVEFSSEMPGDVVDNIASIVYSLSSFSTYGIPSVLIEADARAHLSNYYMSYIERLLSSSTPLLMALRRESRPV